jgi:hypothetical protein
MGVIVMRPRVSLLLLALCLPHGSLAAQGQEREVLGVVRQLFDGMRARDTAKMRAQLHPDARMASPSTRSGTVSVTVESPEAWLAGVARATGPMLDERITSAVVKVDGALASVWASYTFYLGERLSHCGVDAFHLVRLPSGWKIIDLADTRRRENCPTGPDSLSAPPQ